MACPQPRLVPFATLSLHARHPARRPPRRPARAARVPSRSPSARPCTPLRVQPFVSNNSAAHAHLELP